MASLPPSIAASLARRRSASGKKAFGPARASRWVLLSVSRQQPAQPRAQRPIGRCVPAGSQRTIPPAFCTSPMCAPACAPAPAIATAITVATGLS